MDAAELCRNSHANLDFQQAAEQSFALLSDFIIELNADHFLYEEILLPIIQNPIEWSSLTTEEQYFATDLRRDFENEGIHLKGSALQQLKQLQQQVVMAETTWSQNLVNREELQRVIAIGPFPTVSGQTPDHFQTLSKWMQQFSIPKPAKQPQRQQGDRQGGRYLYSTLDRRILQPLMNSIPDEKLRKSLFLESSVQPSANIAALQKLLLTRQSLAHTLQHASYGHRAIMKHVHQSPAYLHDMFKHIAKAVHPVVTRELQSLEEVKRRFEHHHPHERESSSSFSSSLSPWNLGYYQNIARQEKALLSHSQSSSSSSSSARQRISSYFPLDACVDGLRLVSERLFGLSMREVEVEKDYEHWGHSRGEHDQEIRKFEIYDVRRGLGLNGKEIEKGELLGICYFDLFHREHKFPGSAHFTIRCGCERVLDFPSLATSASPAGGFAKLRTDRQTPIVALVFHFQPPHQSHSRTQGFGSSLLDKAGKFFSGGLGAGAGKGNQPLLSLHDIETLFHEWGHALHSLLSQTKFQHLSGTRGGTDFIEVFNSLLHVTCLPTDLPMYSQIPSHLMEHFARDPNVIRQWARHHLTNEKIPEGLLEDALDHKTDFAAIELQHQVLLSGADQVLPPLNRYALLSYPYSLLFYLPFLLVYLWTRNARYHVSS
jgi:intermediate peptidase